MVSHVSGWSLTADKNFIIFHFDCTVLSLRQQITASLTVHSFRSQRCCNQENVSTLQTSFLHSLIQLSYCNFNQCKLFGANTFSFRSVVIGAHLFIFRWEYWRPLTKIYVAFFFKLNKLPLNEWIVIRIHVSCYKGTSVINMYTESI